MYPYQSDQGPNFRPISHSSPLVPPKSFNVTQGLPIPSHPPYPGPITSDSSITTLIATIPPVEEGWLPDVVRGLSTADLQALIRKPRVQTASIQSPASSHPSLQQSAVHLNALLESNISLATHLLTLESHLHAHRSDTQSRLLALRSLEHQFNDKQDEQETALQDFSPRGLFQALTVAVTEGDVAAQSIEQSFLDEREGVASEKEVGEWTRKLKDAKVLACTRKQRKDKWMRDGIGGLKG